MARNIIKTRQKALSFSVIGEEVIRMNESTRLEIIKALAYGEDIEIIANMAEVDVAEIVIIRDTYADEIKRRHEEIMGELEDD